MKMVTMCPAVATYDMCVSDLSAANWKLLCTIGGSPAALSTVNRTRLARHMFPHPRSHFEQHTWWLKKKALHIAVSQRATEQDWLCSL